MCAAVSSTSDAAPPSAFAAAPGAFPAFATQAPASAATAAAMAASPSTATHPPSAAALNAFAPQSFPAGPVQPNVFGPAPSAPPSAFAFAAPAGSGFSSSPFPSAQTHLTPTAHLLALAYNLECAVQLAPHLQTREGVFALSWYEASGAPTRSTLLMRYLAVGARRWRQILTDSIHDEAHGWIVEKLGAELAEGHGYDHELRDQDGYDGLDQLLADWLMCPHLVLSMAPVLLAAPSVAVRLREGGDRRETTRLVETIVSHLDDGPDRLEPCLAVIALIVERGGSFDQALHPIVAQSHMHALLRLIKAATVEQLQSVSLATLNQARDLERQRPYLSPRRLCRELIERVCERQATEALVGSLSSPSSATSTSLPGVPPSLAGSSSSSSPLAAWLSAFESALPDRTFAHQCVARGCSEAEWLAALPRFDWLELAEAGVLWKLQSTEALLDATVERVQQLVARERARAADDEVRPASVPLSPPVIIAHLIIAALASIRDDGRRDPDPEDALLRALLSAATAPVFAGSSPSSPSGGLYIPYAFEIIREFPEDDLMRVALLFHEAGIVADDQGSFTLHLMRSRHWTALRRWMAPENARFSMPLGWLGERDPTVSSEIRDASSELHPHLAAGARCDVWDASCRRSEYLNQYAPIQQLVSHAIDWHYAAVTPALRSALSTHLLPDLHAEVLSFLMPPSTLRDPAPPAAEADSSVRLLDSAVAALLPSQSSVASQLRQVQHQLRQSAVERGFAERAFEAERQMLMLRATQ